MMNRDEHLGWQKKGAEAAALGKSMVDNPLFRPDAMPGTTGESIEEWSAKAEAWEMGRKIEAAIRA